MKAPETPPTPVIDRMTPAERAIFVRMLAAVLLKAALAEEQADRDDDYKQERHTKRQAG
jgi:hypothetical protein